MSTSYAVICPDHGRLASGLWHFDEAEFIAAAHDSNAHRANPTTTVSREDTR